MDYIDFWEWVRIENAKDACFQYVDTYIGGLKVWYCFMYARIGFRGDRRVYLKNASGRVYHLKLRRRPNT